MNILEEVERIDCSDVCFDNTSRITFQELIVIISFLFEKGFRYRRFLLKHKLTDKHKAERLAWCFNIRFRTNNNNNNKSLV